MKIAIVNASDRGGGAEESVLSLHRTLLNAGHHSTVFVGEKKTDEPGVVAIPYVRGFPGSRRLARKIEAETGWQDIYNPSFRNLENVIPSDTDVVHFNNLWGGQGYADLGVLPRLTARFPGVLTERQNWMFTGHCACFHDCGRWRKGCGGCPRLDRPPSIPKDGTRYNWKRKKRLIQASNLAFVGISDYVCRLAQQSPIWKGKRIERIYNGIDLNVFRPIREQRKLELRRQMGIPVDKVAVLLSGQTLAGYRQGIATEGYQALNGLCDPRLFPVLVGRGSEEAQANLTVPSCAVGYRETTQSMADCYQACDLTLVTSEVEAFGRIAAESQACATPVIAFDSGGLSEVVRDGLGGRSVPKGDVEGLQEAIRSLSSDEGFRRTLGTQGVEFVRKTFETRQIAEQYIALYRSLLEGQ